MRWGVLGFAGSAAFHRITRISREALPLLTPYTSSPTTALSGLGLHTLEMHESLAALVRYYSCWGEALCVGVWW